MDPNTLNATLIGVAFGLVKILERTVEWALKKRAGDSKNVVRLDPELARLIVETHQRTGALHDITGVRDHNGVPMVYSSRDLSGDVKAVMEDVRSTALILRDVMHTQQKLLDRLESLDDRVEDVQSTQRAQGRR